MAPSNTKGQKQTILRVLHYIKKYWFFLAVSIVMAAVTVTLTLYLPILTGRAIDLILDKGQVDFPGVFAILKKMAWIIAITAVTAVTIETIIFVTSIC